MASRKAGEHVIVLSGYGPLISVDRLSQSGDELEPKWLRVYIETYVHIHINMNLSVYTHKCMSILICDDGRYKLVAN